MEKLRSYFFFDYRLKFGSWWFKKSLYTYLILRSIHWLIHYKLLFGENSLVYSQNQSIGFFKDFAFFLYDTSSSNLSIYFLLALLLFSFMRLFTNRLGMLIDGIIWFLVINIHNKVYPSLTGGDLLLNQFLFFNVFICSKYLPSNNTSHSIQILVHNFAVLGVLIQICLLYFMAGLAKLFDQGWLEGEALIFVAQIRHFSIFPTNYFPGFDPFLIFLNYLVLFYQLLFPVLVWIKPLKKPLLSIGILMHLYIGIMMGLPEFSAIMIIGYVFFWPQKPSVN